MTGPLHTLACSFLPTQQPMTSIHSCPQTPFRIVTALCTLPHWGSPNVVLALQDWVRVLGLCLTRALGCLCGLLNLSLDPIARPVCATALAGPKGRAYFYTFFPE